MAAAFDAGTDLQFFNSRSGSLPPKKFVCYEQLEAYMAHLKPTDNQSLKAKSARSPETNKPCIQHATSLSDDSAALLRLLESEQFRAPRSPQQGNLFRPRGEVSSAPSSPRPTLQLTAARSSLNRSSVPALDLTKLKASSSDRQSEVSSRGLHRSQSCQSIPSFAISHSKQATELDIMRQLQGDTRPRRDAALPVMGWYPPQDDIGHGGVPELRKPPKYMENPVSERRTTTPRAFYPDAVHEPLGKSISRRRAGSLPSTMTGQETPINEGFSRVRNFYATELGETTRDMIRPFYTLREEDWARAMRRAQTMGAWQYEERRKVKCKELLEAVFLSYSTCGTWQPSALSGGDECKGMMHVNAFISICKDAKLVDEIMPVKRLRQIFLRAAEQDCRSTGKISSKLNFKRIMRTLATISALKNIPFLEVLERLAALNAHGLVMDIEGVVTVQ